MPDKILLADDDEDNRTIMRLALTRAGYAVTLAQDGQEAMDAVKREVPDLILLDLSMPRVTGWEVVRWLKGDPRWRDIPVLAYTAHAMNGDERLALEAGFDGYVPKPSLPRRTLEAVAARLAARGLPS
ncbi:MAG: response regulator [Elusimicrobia bacterium]|nr:response regulator [Elusimicrobiota bacterium]